MLCRRSRHELMYLSIYIHNLALHPVLRIQMKATDRSFRRNSSKYPLFTCTDSLHAIHACRYYSTAVLISGQPGRRMRRLRFVRTIWGRRDGHRPEKSYPVILKRRNRFYCCSIRGCRGRESEISLMYQSISPHLFCLYPLPGHCCLLLVGPGAHTPASCNRLCVRLHSSKSSKLHYFVISKALIATW